MRKTRISMSLLLAIGIIIGLLPVTASAANIPPDAVTYNGRSYAVYSNVEANWNDAETFCKSLGGHLAVIRTQEENDFLHAFIKSKGFDSAYFGLYRSGNSWAWVTGEPLTITNWATSEPNNENGSEDHGMFYYKYQDGTWNDGDYYGSRDGTTFVCEWESVFSSNTSIAVSVSAYETRFINEHLAFIKQQSTMHSNKMAAILLC